MVGWGRFGGVVIIILDGEGLEMSGFQRHNPNGDRRPKGVAVDQMVEVRGGNQRIVRKAGEVAWRNVSSWRVTDLPATKVVDYGFCDGVCDE